MFRIFIKCWLLMCCIAVSRQLEISEFEVPQVVKVGETAELKCRYKLGDGKSDDGYIVKWWMMRVPQNATEGWTTLASVENGSPIYQRIVGEPKATAQHNIVIKEHDTISLLNVTPANSGVYECVVSNYDGEVKKQQELIVFTEGTGPQLNMTTVADGPDADDEDDVNIECIANNVAPSPDLILKLDGIEVNITALIAGPDEAGLYDIYGNATVSKDEANGEVSCELVFMNPAVVHPQYIVTELYVSSGSEDTSEAAEDSIEQATPDSQQSRKVNNKMPVLTGMCLLALACLGLWLRGSGWLAFLIPLLFHHRYLDWISLLCVAALGVAAAAHALMGSHVLSFLHYAMNNLIEATLCALLLRRALPRQDPLSGLSHSMKFLIVAVIFCLHLCRSGEMVLVLPAVSLVRDENQNPLYFISQIEVITELKHTKITKKRPSEAVHEEKELLYITLSSINEAVISTDRNLNITFMNPVAEKMTGWKESQAQGQPVDHIVHITKGLEGPLLNNLQQFDIRENLHYSIEQSLVLHGRDTGMFDVQLAVSPLRTLKDEPIGIVMVLQDVSKSRELMRKLSYSASHDLLTGLANRGSFEKSLKKALSQTAVQDRPHSLAFIDLDRFKLINDTAGHAAGDELLRQISALMQEHIRNGDRLARLGGDEFALILFDCPLDRGLITLQHLISKINEFQFVWEEQIYGIGASAGLTQINDANISGSEYMAQADAACYTAKHNGRGRVFTYESWQKLQLSSHSVLFRPEITSILSENQLTLHCRAASAPKTLRPKPDHGSKVQASWMLALTIGAIVTRFTSLV